VARQSSNRPEADEPAADAAASAESANPTEPADASLADAGLAEPGPTDTGPTDTGPTDTNAVATGSADTGPADTGPADTGPSDPEPADAGEADAGQPDADDAVAVGDRAVWDQARVAPVEIALPGGVGYTLRAYRRAAELTPTETDLTDEDPFDARERADAARRAEEDGDEEVIILDEEYAALVEGDEETSEPTKGDEPATDAAEPEPADFADEQDDAAAKAAEEEVPIFLSHKGRLLLFKSPESLVSFIRSGAPHDLAQLDTWSALAERVQADDVAPLEEDTYVLDLVVENLRGGHDTWDLDLLIQAGEIARDLGHALRLRPVIMALSAGSPLDDLDDSLRSASNGGMGGFFGRRKLRKIGAQQASLGWRSVIGKISAAVDWRD
jgi:hypothetical protein